MGLASAIVAPAGILGFSGWHVWDGNVSSLWAEWGKGGKYGSRIYVALYAVEIAGNLGTSFPQSSSDHPTGPKHLLVWEIRCAGCE